MVKHNVMNDVQTWLKPLFQQETERDWKTELKELTI